MKNKNKIIVLIAFITGFLLSSCRNNSSSDNDENLSMQGDTVYVNPQSTVFEKIKTLKVAEEDFKREMITAGTVKAIPYLYAEIAPPFSGRVTKVHMRLGMKTQAGTPLFEMVSPEFTDAQKLYFQAKSELEVAKLTLKRQQDLKANGVGAERDLEEAETNFEVKEKEFQNAAASLKIFGVDVNKLVFGQPLVITSPIAGEVVENDLVNGHFIKSDDPPHAKVADLSKVWVVGMVKEKDIRFVYDMESAEIMVAAYPGRKIIGKVFHVNEIIDEETRSVQVLVECDNKDRTLKPGMYVTVRFVDAPEKALFVPAKAVLQYNDKSYVFVQIKKGAYIRKFVETGVSKNDQIQIINGLMPGEIIISEGAFYLLEAK
jgi:cobalt-zinc-cadmium efflux system membrane fusion protein